MRSIDPLPIDITSDQIIHSTSVLGTPKEETWKGVSQLPDYKETFPTWSAQNLSTLVKNLDANGVDLLQVSCGSKQHPLQS